MEILVKYIDIPDYQFDINTNPFAFDAKPQRLLTGVAKTINHAINTNFNTSDLLIRGIQSSQHLNIYTRDELIEIIKKEGSDFYSNDISEQDVIFAAPYESGASIESILAGFHIYKPKCEELPQYPVDIWMIFDAGAYENIEYIHPRHGVVAQDKWQLKKSGTAGLMGILVVN